MSFRIIHLIMFMNFLKTDVLRNFHTIKIVIELNSENNCSLYMVTAVILNLKKNYPCIIRSLECNCITNESGDADTSGKPGLTLAIFWDLFLHDLLFFYLLPLCLYWFCIQITSLLEYMFELGWPTLELERA